jgi:hypothetical protein
MKSQRCVSDQSTKRSSMTCFAQDLPAIEALLTPKESEDAARMIKRIKSVAPTRFVLYKLPLPSKLTVKSAELIEACQTAATSRKAPPLSSPCLSTASTTFSFAFLSKKL